LIALSDEDLIQRRDGLAGYVTEFIYPSASNRLNTQRESAVGVWSLASPRLLSGRITPEPVYLWSTPSH